MRAACIIVPALLLAGVNAAAINRLLSRTPETQESPKVSNATTPIFSIGPQTDGEPLRLFVHYPRGEEVTGSEDRAEETIPLDHDVSAKHLRRITFHQPEWTNNEAEWEEEEDEDDDDDIDDEDEDFNALRFPALFLHPKVADDVETNADESKLRHDRRDSDPQLVAPKFDDTKSPPFSGDVDSKPFLTRPKSGMLFPSIEYVQDP